MSVSHRQRDENGRFLPNAGPDYVIDPAGCWVWAKARSHEYGRIFADARQQFAHRVYHERYVGPIPEGYEVDHLCRNTLCVNPAHLEAVTPRENNLRSDSWAGRNARRTHCPHGHPYEGDNLIVTRRGFRVCRVCKSNTYRAWYARKKQREQGLDVPYLFDEDRRRRMREARWGVAA